MMDTISMIERMLNSFVQERRMLLIGADELLRAKINNELETADLFNYMIGVAKNVTTIRP